MSVLAVLLAPRAAWASQERDERILGVYVTSLRDFDPSDDSIGIDFWVWSVDAPGNDQLKKLEFVNAKQLDIRLERTNRRGNEEWSRSKVRATVLHDWNLTNFPFDRQTLTVDLGLSGPDATGYLVDRAGSGIAENIGRTVGASRASISSGAPSRRQPIWETLRPPAEAVSGTSSSALG